MPSHGDSKLVQAFFQQGCERERGLGEASGVFHGKYSLCPSARDSPSSGVSQRGCVASVHYGGGERLMFSRIGGHPHLHLSILRVRWRPLGFI